MQLSLRQSITLLVIGGYLILNTFFMLVRFPPVAGGGVPVGEILLLSWFCFIVKDLRWFPLFSNNIIFLPFLLWWVFGIGKVSIAFSEYGMWAFRDATHVIESLFLWVGFVYASTHAAVDHFFIWLRRVLILGMIYAFSWPWRDTLISLSPTITAAAGYKIKVFVNYNTSAILLIWEATRRLIGRAGSFLVPSLLIAYTVAVFQARTIYLQIIAILLLVFWHRRVAFLKMSLTLGVCLMIIFIYAELGIDFKGRLGQSVSPDFLARHFAAIAGIESEGVEGAARGVGQRFGWWKSIFEKLMDSSENFILGLGYGFPLIEFQGGKGEIVREPHNSYISIFARLGLVGFICFTWMHVHLVRAWLRAYNLCQKFNYRVGQDRLFMFMVYFVLVWVNSLGEDAFEKPYITIPYYFFWGVVLHYRIHLKRMFASGKVITKENTKKEFALHAHPDSP